MPEDYAALGWWRKSSEIHRQFPDLRMQLDHNRAIRWARVIYRRPRGHSYEVWLSRHDGWRRRVAGL